MIECLRRLHARGAASRGICVDAQGALLGPETILVYQSFDGYETISRQNARKLQKVVLNEERDPDWLFSQCHRIAKALSRNEITIAQIYGLYIPICELDDRQLRRLSDAGRVAKAGFNPDEPRVPSGSPGGGEWTNGGDEPASPDGALSAEAGTAEDAPSGDTGPAHVPALGQGESGPPPAKAGTEAAGSVAPTGVGVEAPSPRPDQVADIPLERTKRNCIAYCYARIEGLRDLSGDPFWACLRACQGFWPNPLFPEFD